MLIGKKVGMTQVVDETGAMVPVTVVDASSCSVVQVKRRDGEGYEAVQLGFGERRPKTTTKAETGHCAQHGGKGPARILREFRVEDASAFSPGQTVGVDGFAVGANVDVTGISIGRGFQGTRKRHHFSGGKETHGTKTHDQPGSIGASAYPSRVIKGKKLPGQMGNVRRTVRNLRVVGVDADANVLLLHGSVPGARNGYLLIRRSQVKKPRATRGRA